MIYFIQSGDSQFVKIGFCAGEPKMRLGQLQCGNPEPLKLLAVRAHVAKARQRRCVQPQVHNQGGDA